MDTSTLKIVINTQDALTASQNLDKLDKTVNKIDKSSAGLSRVTSILNLQNIILTGTVAKLATESVKMADTYTDMQSRLALVTKGTKELNSVQDELFKSSQRTRTSYEGSVELYSRIAQATEPLKLSNERLLAITETINKAGIISGGSAEGIKAAMIQLGQGLSSGTLRGDELSSVLEQMPRLARIISDSMGVEVGALRTLAEQGLITNKVVIKALESQAKTIDKEFAKMKMTVSQAFTTMSNSMLDFIGKADKATGASSALAGAINDIGTSISTMTDGLTTKEIQTFYVEATAYFKSFGYGVNYVYEVLENAGQGIVYGLNSTVYGALEVLLKMALETTKILNKTGLSSDDTLLKTEKAYNEILFQRKNANNGLSESLKEVQEAQKRASISVTDWIKIGYAELKLAQTTAKLKEKEEAKNNTTKKKLKTAGDIKKELGSDKEAKEADKLENEKLNQLENYYRIVEEYDKGWEKKKQQLDKDNLIEDKALYEKFLEVEKKNYYKPLEELKQKAIDDEISYQDTINEKIMERSKLLVEENEKTKNTQLELSKSKFDELTMNIDSDNISQLENNLISISESYTSFLEKIGDNNSEQAQKLSVDYLNSVKKITDEMEKIRSFDFTIKLQGFDDISNGIAGIVNGFNDVTSMQETYNSNMEKAKGDVGLQDKLTQKYASDTMGAYTNMVGAIGNFYDEDDSRRKKQAEVMKVMNAAQMAMQLAQMAQSTAFTGLFVSQEAIKAQAAGVTAVAVAAQSSPWTGFATAAAMAAMLASFGIMLSGSGGGASDPTAQVKRDEEDYKAGQDLVVGRLDRQIELLENIDKNGSAQKAEITVSKTSFDRTLKELSYSTAKFVGVADKTGQDVKARVARPIEIAESVGIDIGDIQKYHNGAYGRVWIDTRGLAGDVENSLKFIAALYESIDNTGMIEKATVYGWVDDAQEALNNYANSMVDIVGEMQNASDNLQDAYDKITGTTTYETLRLQEAYSDFDEIRGSLSYAEYIKNQIQAIKQVEDSFGDDIVSLLLSSDFNDFSKQVEALNELSKVTGIAFSGGVEDALNYIDSIELVADAQSELVDKMKDFIDGMNDMGDSIQDTINKLLGIENNSQSAMISDFWDKKSQADTILAKGSNMSEEDIDTLGNLIKDINTLSTSIQGENKGTTANLVDELLKLKLGVSTANLPSFDVGSSYIPNDMTANIHKGEMIVPKNFADSVRAGQISIGGNSYNTDTKRMEQALFLMNDKLGKVIAINDRQLSTQRQQLSMMEA